MSKNKWDFATPQPDEPPPEKIERGGMMVVLIIGLVLFIGGIIFAWKIGAFDINSFFGKLPAHSRTRTEVDILLLIHCPWLLGAWMIKSAIRYFWIKRKQE